MGKLENYELDTPHKTIELANKLRDRTIDHSNRYVVFYNPKYRCYGLSIVWFWEMRNDGVDIEWGDGEMLDEPYAVYVTL